MMTLNVGYVDRCCDTSTNATRILDLAMVLMIEGAHD